MIYRGFELSLSLNGKKLVHIARSAAGLVAFRESSEQSLKRAIDNYRDEKQKEEALEAKKKAERARAKLKKQEELPEPETTPTEQVVIPQQLKVTRGPDGKFISRSALEDTEEPKKKSFWDKLK